MSQPYQQPPPPPRPPRAPLRLVPPAPTADPALQALAAELEAARHELAALEDLLEDLPGIFERKFRQRLEGVMAEQRLLSEQNRYLRQRILASAVGTGDPSGSEPVAPPPFARLLGLLSPGRTAAPTTDGSEAPRRR